jgi:hypothetical protein
MPMRSLDEIAPHRLLSDSTLAVVEGYERIITER